MTSIIREWRAKQVKAEIAGQVVAGMDTACAFVADQARANAPERTGLTKRDIAHEVEVDGDTIEGRVGVKKGKAFYAFFLEYGTSKMAARPFLRPAVLQNARQIVKLIAGGK